MFSVLLYNTFTVQILYRLYNLHLNCTYSNYTEAAATCSAAQHHSTFTVQILYKLYSLQLNCTYSNYTEAAATFSAAQQHTNYQSDVFWSEVKLVVWNYIVAHIQRLDPSDSRYWLQEQCCNLTVIWTSVCYKCNWQTVQTEDQRRYSLCQMEICVRVCGFIFCYCNWLTVQLAFHVN
jgi:hypothetical protein